MPIQLLESTPGRSPSKAPTIHEDPPLAIDDLDQDTRATLGPTLHEIFCESYGALDAATVCDEIVFRSGGSLYLYRDDAGQIVGFLSLAIRSLAIEGRMHGIVEGGVYFRRRCRRAGARATARGVLHCLVGYKLRHPLRPLRYVCEALSPASYRTVARWFPRVYPSRRGPTPPADRQVLTAVLDQRALLRTDDPFVVHYPDPATHRDLERLGSARSLRDDPDVRFYLQRNPRFAEGHILCVVASVDWRDCLLGLGRYCGRIILRSLR